MEVSREGYGYLGKPIPSQEVVNKSIAVRTTGIADTGCTVLCGGLETLRKQRIQRSILQHGHNSSDQCLQAG